MNMFYQNQHDLHRHQQREAERQAQQQRLAAHLRRDARTERRASLSRWSRFISLFL